MKNAMPQIIKTVKFGPLGDALHVVHASPRRFLVMLTVGRAALPVQTWRYNTLALALAKAEALEADDLGGIDPTV
jgi:hypothetical protein